MKTWQNETDNEKDSSVLDIIIYKDIITYRYYYYKRMHRQYVGGLRVKRIQV